MSAVYAIRLTECQVAHATDVSARRQAINRASGRPNQNNFDLDPLAVDRIGAICEYAASLYLGLPWNDPVRDAPVKKPDVGPYYVKGTVLPDHYRGQAHLIVRESDLACPPGLYILAVLAGVVVRFAGWCPIGVVRSIGTWMKRRPDRPAWWVAEGDLEDMGDLPLDSRSTLLGTAGAAKCADVRSAPSR
jgi:hypothetical protein